MKPLSSIVLAATFALSVSAVPTASAQSVDALAAALSGDPKEREKAVSRLTDFILTPDSAGKSFASADADRAALGATAREWAKTAEPRPLAMLLIASTPKSDPEPALRAMLAHWTEKDRVSKDSRPFLTDAANKAGLVFNALPARANGQPVIRPQDQAAVERARTVKRGGAPNVFGPDRAPEKLTTAGSVAALPSRTGLLQTEPVKMTPPLPTAVRATIPPPVAPAASTGKKTLHPDPPLIKTSHQAMASEVIGRFGINDRNGEPCAMQVVITARGGGENSTSNIKGKGGPEWARAELSALFPNETPFTDPHDMRLARIDHIINVQMAANNFAPMKESDPWYVKSWRTIKRMPVAAGGAVITLAYDASKAVDQGTGYNLTGWIGKQNFNAPDCSPVDLKNTAGALWMSVKSPFLIEQ